MGNDLHVQAILFVSAKEFKFTALVLDKHRLSRSFIDSF